MQYILSKIEFYFMLYNFCPNFQLEEMLKYIPPYISVKCKNVHFVEKYSLTSLECIVIFEKYILNELHFRTSNFPKASFFLFFVREILFMVKENLHLELIINYSRTPYDKFPK